MGRPPLSRLRRGSPRSFVGWVGTAWVAALLANGPSTRELSGRPAPRCSVAALRSRTISRRSPAPGRYPPADPATHLRARGTYGPALSQPGRHLTGLAAVVVRGRWSVGATRSRTASRDPAAAPRCGRRRTGLGRPPPNRPAAHRCTRPPGRWYGSAAPPPPFRGGSGFPMPDWRRWDNTPAA